MAQLFDNSLIQETATELGISSLDNATIGQVIYLAMELEKKSETTFVRMDQGVPGLLAAQIGKDAEREALLTNVAAIYPPAQGIAPLKNESSRFIKAFMGVDVSPTSCIPVTGSVEGSFASFIMANQCKGNGKVLFIDPGFPIQKSQLNILGIDWESFDIYNYRGKALESVLDQIFAKGDIGAIVYSNPNNPAWFCLNETELEIIGRLATKYDVIVLEDLAYFAMDFRSDLSVPFTAPYQPTVARYTDNYIIMLSGSKIFSYAGQRVAVVAISDKLYARRYSSLEQRYGSDGEFGSVMTNAVLYMITSGVTHTTQYALAAMFKAASDGKLNFVEDTKEYGRRTQAMKRIFCENGFHIVYDKDMERDIADGFFFTIGYDGMTSGELMSALIGYGISSISLTTTGSKQSGVRCCCSRMSDDILALLEERVKLFNIDHQ